MKPTRTAAAVLVTAALAMLTAACGGSPSSAGPGGSPNAGGSSDAKLVAYSQCMRSHGVPSYPDPAGGVLPKGGAQQFGVSSARFQTAQGACQHLLPATSGSLSSGSLQQCYLTDVCPQAVVQQALNAGRGFARCMRSHGVPYWPDPSIDSEGRPQYDITVPRPAPQQVSSAINTCSRLDPAGSLLAWG